MRIIQYISIILLVLVLSFAAHSSEDVRQREDLSKDEVDTAIAKLNDENTRLAALEQLITFSSMKIYQVGSVYFSSGNKETDSLMEKAADAAKRYRDYKTLSSALNSSRPSLQFWALWNIPRDFSKSTDPWKTLLPRIKKLAKNAGGSERRAAQRYLKGSGIHKKFLDECVESETYANNIMHMVGANRMNPHLLRLLKHEDEKVRVLTLVCISGNNNPARAPMWKITFNSQVFTRTMKLSYSDSAKERSAAVAALAALRKHDPQAIRERMIELADDTSSDVRWRIPRMLSHHKDRADVRKVLSKLLKDKSALVRFFTILELGPEEHIAELEAIAGEPDSKVAKWAKSKLKQIANKKRKKPKK